MKLKKDIHSNYLNAPEYIIRRGLRDIYFEKKIKAMQFFPKEIIRKLNDEFENG